MSHIELYESKHIRGGADHILFLNGKSSIHTEMIKIANPSTTTRPILPLRAIYFHTLQYETPCICVLQQLSREEKKSWARNQILNQNSKFGKLVTKMVSR